MLYQVRWKKDNCWSEQSPDKSIVSTVPFFWGHPVYSKIEVLCYSASAIEQPIHQFEHSL